MKDLNQERVTEELLLNMKDNFFSYSKVPNTLTDYRYKSHLFYSGISHPLFNNFSLFQGGESELDEIDIFFKERKVPYSYWCLSDGREAALYQKLEKRGFKNVNTTVVSALLTDGKIEKPIPSGHEIIRVQSMPEFMDWLSVYGPQFEIDPEARKLVESWGIYYGLKSHNTLMMVLKDKEVVAVGSCFFNSESAAVNNMVVPHKHRRKGYGALLLEALAREVKSKGFSYTIMNSSQMGLNLYRRYSFFEFGNLAMMVKPLSS